MKEYLLLIFCSSIYEKTKLFVSCLTEPEVLPREMTWRQLHANLIQKWKDINLVTKNFQIIQSLVTIILAKVITIKPKWKTNWSVGHLAKNASLHWFVMTIFLLLYDCLNQNVKINLKNIQTLILSCVWVLF